MRSAPPVTLAFDARRALCVSPVGRHGFANQYEAQTGTVPGGDIKPLRLKPQTDADGLRSRSPSVPAAKPDGACPRMIADTSTRPRLGVAVGCQLPSRGRPKRRSTPAPSTHAAPHRRSSPARQPARRHRLQPLHRGRRLSVVHSLSVPDYGSHSLPYSCGRLNSSSRRKRRGP